MVSIEPIMFVIRIGKNHEKLGDPYDTACSAVKQLDGSVELVALNGKFSKKAFEEIERQLADFGFTVARWKRIKDGKLRIIEHRIKV